jgi:hypothetical protein
MRIALAILSLRKEYKYYLVPNIQHHVHLQLTHLLMPLHGSLHHSLELYVYQTTSNCHVTRTVPPQHKICIQLPVPTACACASEDSSNKPQNFIVTL